MKRVFVSGCFDLLHSGHIRFLEEASKHGELYVSVGSDTNIWLLKGRKPVYNEDERLYMIQSLKFVKSAFIPTGEGDLDFLPEFLSIQPDILVVNEDGDREGKRMLCKDTNTEYIVLRRIPKEGLPKRSTTELRKFL